MTPKSPFEDIDPTETQEWLESIDSVLRAQGPERAHFLLEKLVDFTRRSGTYLPFKPNTAYLNTISRAQEPEYPGDRSLERRNEAYLRWNALAMVVQANRQVGPEQCMEIVEQRAPDGFTNLDDIVSQQELEEISRAYKRTAGFDPETLNSRPSLSVR